MGLSVQPRTLPATVVILVCLVVLGWQQTHAAMIWCLAVEFKVCLMCVASEYVIMTYSKVHYDNALMNLNALGHSASFFLGFTQGAGYLIQGSIRSES